MGDKVFGSANTGAYAEKIVVDASAIHLLPEVLIFNYLFSFY